MGGLGGPRFRLLTGRATAEELEAAAGDRPRRALARSTRTLATREWLVGERRRRSPTLGLFPYVSVSPVDDRPLRGGRVAGPRPRAAGVRRRLRAPIRRTLRPGAEAARSISVPRCGGHTDDLRVGRRARGLSRAG